MRERGVFLVGASVGEGPTEKLRYKFTSSFPVVEESSVGFFISNIYFGGSFTSQGFNGFLLILGAAANYKSQFSNNTNKNGRNQNMQHMMLIQLLGKFLIKHFVRINQIIMKILPED